MRKAFAEALVSLAKKDEKLVVLIGDISHHLLRGFESAFPSRFYNVGVCEQSIIGIAAGLALEGWRPVVHTIAPFCVERAYEQIKVDLCYQKLDVTIVSVGASFDYAQLGCTHHCYEDISILRPLPNIDIYAPGSPREFKDLFSKSWKNGRPKYFKLSKEQHTQEFEVCPGESYLLNTGAPDKAAIFVTGALLDVVASLSEHTLVYLPTIEPLSPASEEQIKNIISRHKKSVVVEENAVVGALGDKIFDIASRNDLKANIRKVGIPREFCENYGTASQHREHLGLTYEKICEILHE